jgi:predicted Rossmann-fold nucleotide-binding protein
MKAMVSASSFDEFERWLADMPGRESLPFEVNPAKLYTVPKLYEGFDLSDPSSWKKSRDNRIYDWFLEPKVGGPHHLKQLAAVATRLHDTAIEHGIAYLLKERQSVGFMGGHNVKRNEGSFQRVAEMARILKRRGFMIISGGGPGLMEAANFGAFMAAFDDEKFNPSLEILRSAPDYDNKEAWIASAARVRANLLGRWNDQESEPSWNLGVPTWLYGAEPPNLFATHIAKYFYNSLREDGLVTIANGGLIFGEGAAGTVQEIFQDTTLNYYRAQGVAATPMILYGANFWNPGPGSDEPLNGNQTGLPAYKLLQKLARDATPPFLTALLLSDDPAEIVDFLIDQNSDQAKVARRIASEHVRAQIE